MPNPIMEQLPEIIGAVGAIAAGVSLGALEGFLKRRRQKSDASKPYSERLAELTSNLSRATSEVDSILRDLSRVAKERSEAVDKLEVDLSRLQKRERELKQIIETLQGTPIPVAEHFAKLVQTGDRRGAKRDVLLFIAGVVVSTVIGIMIEVVF